MGKAVRMTAIAHKNTDCRRPVGGVLFVQFEALFVVADRRVHAGRFEWMIVSLLFPSFRRTATKGVATDITIA